MAQNEKNMTLTEYDNKLDSVITGFASLATALQVIRAGYGGEGVMIGEREIMDTMYTLGIAADALAGQAGDLQMELTNIVGVGR